MEDVTLVVVLSVVVGSVVNGLVDTTGGSVVTAIVVGTVKHK